MTASTYNLTCDSYKHTIFSGFTRLQEQQEFVDLTLAADGYLVKVHKNIMALASPYIKDLVKTTSSDNPVIYLHNVNHNLLKYLLEYIYQGEVNIPQESLESFMQLSQSLHITGMNKTNTSKNVLQTALQNQNLGTSARHQIDQRPPTNTLEHANIVTSNNKNSITNVAACITINEDHNLKVQQYPISNVEGSNHLDLALNNDDIELLINSETIKTMPVIVAAEKSVKDPENMETEVTLPQGDHALVGAEQSSVPTIQVLSGGKQSSVPTVQVLSGGEQSSVPTVRVLSGGVQSSVPTIQVLSGGEQSSVPTVRVLSGAELESAAPDMIDLNMPINLDRDSKDALKLITQFSTTERGSVQIIVSRYIYCSHHSSRGGRKHRWRCVDYRKLRCPAYIDSLDNKIISRVGFHSHGFHDDRIYKKHQKNIIFNSYMQAKDAWLPKPVTDCNDIDSNVCIELDGKDI